MIKNEEQAREFTKEETCGPASECFFCQAEGYMNCINGPEMKAKEVRINELESTLDKWIEEHEPAVLRMGNTIRDLQAELQKERERSKALLESLQKLNKRKCLLEQHWICPCSQDVAKEALAAYKSSEQRGEKQTEIKDYIDYVLMEDADLAPLTKEKKARLTERLFKLLTMLEIQGKLKP